MRAELKIVLKWFLVIILILGLVLVSVSIWYINKSENTDKQSEIFAQQFQEDLLEGDYESILNYTYVPDKLRITATDIETYLLSYDGMSVILQNPDDLEIGEFGDTERRCIEVSGYDNEDNYYYFLIDVKIVDDEMLLDFSEQMSN